MRRTKEESLVTRERIIQASYEIIREKGYDQMTRDDIAFKVGMTRGAVNWHFSSKEEIYLAALTKILEDFQRQRQAFFCDEKLSPEEKIERLIYMPIEMQQEYRFINSIPTYLLERQPFKDIISQMAQNRRQCVVQIERCLAQIEAQSGRTYENRKDLAYILYFLHEGFRADHAETVFENGQSIEREYQNYLRLLLHL